LRKKRANNTGKRLMGNHWQYQKHQHATYSFSEDLQCIYWYVPSIPASRLMWLHTPQMI